MARRLPALLAALAAAALVATLHVYGGSRVLSPGGRGEITVYLCAAAEKPWEEIIKEFEHETGIKVNAIYGSSGRLYAMIRMSRRGDVYASASPLYMAMAVLDGLVRPDSVRPVAYLVPVILVPQGNPAGVRGLADLLKPGIRVAIGDPSHVVVGQYAVEVLKHNGLWPQARRNIVVYAENFAKLVALVATGAVDAAIGWHVAGYWYPGRVEVVWLKPGQVPEASYIAIGVLKTSRNPEAARRFIEFVTGSDYARKVWSKYHYFTSPQEVWKVAPGASIPSIEEVEERLQHSGG
ncbi:hypothetical protein CF15_01435 [Pyrodictium occultum]|uniref:Molybdenum ABC transporter substrate-binding protein n=1 Tax=Pyrodictium occultum TaxID=2309 RepID=A0A0V8RTZ1_PYROC|nr:molybdate ABC transporter substrate-binding protein [Pyrodictium occultum]KSW11529.1 hypothetical protein CF15_01435 [Pyrodictium occultum]